MNGRPFISAYTPSSTDPELLKRIFVQREKLLKRVVGRMARSVTSGDKHHMLLVGPRGSGKTHLVSLVAWELKKRKELNDVMRIAWLGEDDCFTGFIHLAFGIASQLHTEYPEEFPADFKSSVRGLPPNEAARSVLDSIIEQLQHRSLILITENMDQTFRSIGDSGQKNWRAFLQESRKFAILATSQQLFAGVSDRKEAFFGFFDIQHLKTLSINDARALICKISVEQGKSELVTYLNTAEGRFRIRALHYLAGGNHRMYVLLSEFLTKDSLDDLVEAFENLAHGMTPYFQERLRSLPDQQRQLVQCLCDAEGALTVKGIAEETFIDTRSCSKQLGTLKAKGYVRSEKRGKESYYDMAEPLMRLCLEVKNQRGKPLKMVARFLRAWFPASILEESGRLASESERVKEYRLEALRTGNLNQSAIAENLNTEFREMMKTGRYETAKGIVEEMQFSDKIGALSAEAELVFQGGDLAGAIAKWTKLIEHPQISTDQKAKALNNRGATYSQHGETKLALSDYSTVIDMPCVLTGQKARALYNRGLTYSKQGEGEFALGDFSAVIAIPDAPTELKAKAFYNRSVAYGQKGALELALSDSSAVIDMPDAPTDLKARAFYNRGLAYSQKGALELAISNFSVVIDMPNAPTDPKVMALNNRGIAYGQKGTMELAMSDYSAVIEMPDAPMDQKALALNNRGIAYGQNGNVDLALSDFSVVIDMPDASADQKAAALNNRGIAYGQKGAVQHAISNFSVVIDMPNAPMEQMVMAFNNRGIAYGQKGAVELALSDFSVVIDMPDASADQKAMVLNNRGITYNQKGAVELAISDYSAVIEMLDASTDQKARALNSRGALTLTKQEFRASQTDFDELLKLTNVSSQLRTQALFAIPTPMIDHCSRDEVMAALAMAFKEGDPQWNGYGGVPQDLLWMVLRRGPVEWAGYVSDIVALFIQYDAAEKLGQGVTNSIKYLDSCGYSESQLNAWNSAWQTAGQDCEDLQIPLRCLNAAVEVITSEPRTDRPLFQLPLEIRKLVRPLLNQSLGPMDS